jgi:tetratricopeptide (TPR) repeat protein
MWAVVTVVSDAAKQHFDEAQALRQAGQLCAALTRFDDVAEQAPDWWRTYKEASTLLRQMGLPIMAAARLRAARERGLHHDELRIEQAYVYAANGDARAAAREFSAMAGRWPTRAPLWLGACEQWRRSRHYQRAIAAARAGAACQSVPHVSQRLKEEHALCLLAIGQHLEEASALLASVVSDTGQLNAMFHAVAIPCARGRFRKAHVLLSRLAPHIPAGQALQFSRLCRAVDRTQRLVKSVGTLERPSERLRVAPVFAREERPLEELTRHADSSTGAITRYFVLDATLPEQHSPDLPPAIANCVARDLEWVRSDGLVRPTERAFCLYDVRGAFVFNYAGRETRIAVLTTEGGFIDELVESEAVVRLSRLATLPATNQVASSDTVFVLPSPAGSWDNHFLAMTRVLPALSLYSELKLTCPIVAPGPLSDSRRALVAAAGIAPSTEFLTPSDVADVTFRRALCPGQALGQRTVTWLRQAGRALEQPDARADGRVLYISRRGQPHRALVNEQALEEALVERFNASCVQMESLSLRDQASAIRRATVVVSPHGAGLANIAFAEPGLWVLEMLSSEYRRLTFRRLSTVCGHRYVPVVGQPEGKDLSWMVDIDKVVQVVGRILDAARRSH